MKKYYICFFILAALLVAAIFTGSYFYMFRPQPERAYPNGVMESETFMEDNMVINQRLVRKQELVNEDVNESLNGNSNENMNEAMNEAVSGEPEEIQNQPEESLAEEAEGNQYCLVAENGFLLVFAKDRYTVCLDTHMPLAEFPEQEQQKLLEGIWFSTMIEIFNYLESYSS